MTQSNNSIIIEIEGKSFCILGATGVVGSEVVKSLKLKLSNEFNLLGMCVDFLADFSRNQLVEDLKSKKNDIIVVHAAWYTQPKLYWSSPLNDDWKKSTVAFCSDLARDKAENVTLHFLGSRAEIEYPNNAYSRAKSDLNYELRKLSKNEKNLRIKYYYTPTVLSEKLKYDTFLYKLLDASFVARNSYGFENDDKRLKFITSSLLADRITNYIMTDFDGSRFQKVHKIGFEVSINNLFQAVKHFLHTNDLNEIVKNLSDLKLLEPGKWASKYIISEDLAKLLCEATINYQKLKVSLK